MTRRFTLNTLAIEAKSLNYDTTLKYKKTNSLPLLFQLHTTTLKNTKKQSKNTREQEHSQILLFLGRLLGILFIFVDNVNQNLTK